METLLEYLIKSSAVLTLFYLCFKTLLSKETYFTAKRVYLLLGLLTSLLIPFVVIKNYVTVVSSSFVWNDGPVNLSSLTTPQSPIWDWGMMLIQIYFTGVFLMFLRLIYQSFTVFKLINSGRKNKINGYTHVHVDHKILPFSFFKYIVFNPSNHSKTTLDTILIHEKEHCRQWHSLDVLGAQLFLIVHWFNPFAWLYQKEVAQNLEYVADQTTAIQVKSIKEYQYVLLDLAVGKQNLAIINPFYNSLIKNRIFMLNKKKSNAKNLWKLVPIVPLTLMFVFAFNTKTIAQVEQANVVQKTNVFVSKVDKNSTDKSLEEKVQFYREKGVDLDFKRVKRNDKGEITSIKATYENRKGSTGQYAVQGTEPINPFNLSVEIEEGEVVRVDFQSTAVIPPPPPTPSKPLPHKVNRRHKIVKDVKFPNSNIKFKAVVVDSLETQSKITILNEENDWKARVKEFEWIDEEGLERIMTIINNADSLRLKIKDHNDKLLEILQVNIDSIIESSVIIDDFDFVVDDNFILKDKN